MNDEGDITEISQRIGDSSAIYSMGMTSTSNLRTSPNPPTIAASATYHYTYDDAVHRFRLAWRDAYGYESKTEYDYALGVPTQWPT